MYTINTQLAYFRYNFDSKKMIVNMRWFKLNKLKDLFFACKSFSKREAEQFKGFIDQNPANFPGSHFVVETQREYFGRFRSNERSKNALPLYFILSQNADVHSGPHIYETMMVRLTDEDYKITINYTLNFDVIGKIEIYK